MATKKQQTITLTAGEQSENHVGMFKQGGGLAEKGYDLEDLRRFQEVFDKLGCETKICGLHLVNPDLDLPEAYILLIRKGCEKLLGKKNAEKMFFEQAELDWDKKYWDTRRGKVLNKHARHNLCYGEKSREPDYENKKGRIVGYDEIPLTKKYSKRILEIFGEKASELEGNFYYDLDKTGVGAHGDAERKIVIGLRLGETCPLKYCWYQNSEKITKVIKFDLNGGDMYVMSEKATGHDWKKKSLKTLRHCAGGEKYLKFP